MIMISHLILFGFSPFPIYLSVLTSVLTELGSDLRLPASANLGTLTSGIGVLHRCPLQTWPIWLSFRRSDDIHVAMWIRLSGNTLQ